MRSIPRGGKTPALPSLGTLLVDSDEQVPEFHGEFDGLRYICAVTGGREWVVDPADVQPAAPAQPLRAQTAVRTRAVGGEVL